MISDLGSGSSVGLGVVGGHYSHLYAACNAWAALLGVICWSISIDFGRHAWV